MMQTIRGFDKAKAVREASLAEALEGTRTAEATAKCVLMVLTTYTDDRGVAWPSVSTLARNTGLSPSCVRRACKALRDLGVLEFEDCAGGRRSKVRTVRFDRLPGASNPVTEPRHPAPGASPARAPGATNRTENPPEKRPAEHQPGAIAHDSPPRQRERPASTPATEDAAASLLDLGFGEPEVAAARTRYPGEPLHTLALLALGVDAAAVRSLVAQHSRDAILAQVQSVNAKRRSSKPPRSSAAYVVKAIREGWAPSAALSDHQRRAKQRAARERVDRERAAQRLREEAYAGELEEQRRQTMARLRAMPDEEIEGAWQRFLESRPAINQLVLKKYDPRENHTAAGLLLGWLDDDSSTPMKTANH